MRVQAEIDRMDAEIACPNRPRPTLFAGSIANSIETRPRCFASRDPGRVYQCSPGMAVKVEHDVAVGRHQPPSSDASRRS